MEINNFIIFIIIILLSIVLYKCAKIFNLRKMEKFDNTQLGLGDGHGNTENNVDPLTGNYINCKGNWGSCISYDDNNSCKKTYEIENEDYIGGSCAYNTGDIKECIFDKCNNINTYEVDDVEYHIMRGKTLVHYKRDNINDNQDIQEDTEYIGNDTGGSGSDLWNNSKDGDDPNIQSLKLEKIMKEYKDNSDYIGLIKDDVLDGIPKFYPIVLDENSEIKIVHSPRRTLYMKKNIDCRGKWGKCEYNNDKKKSERNYIIKYPGSGTGSNCTENNNEQETCSEWGSCVIENNPINNESRNIKKWQYKLSDCSDINEDCSNAHNKIEHQEWIEEGCIQDNDCGVSWGDCDFAGGKRSKKATINPPKTGSGKCAYIDKEWYHSKIVFNKEGEKIELICDPINSPENCICDKEDFPIPCKKKYNIYWGNGPWKGVKKNKDGIILRKKGIPIPINEVSPQASGKCWLHIYDYERANNKLYELLEGGSSSYCPLNDYYNLDDYYNNVGSAINIGEMLDKSKNIDIGDSGGIGFGDSNIGFKFGDTYTDLEECRGVGINSTNCKHSSVRIGCGDPNYEGSREIIQITESPKYGGICPQTNGHEINNNCTRIPPPPPPPPLRIAPQRSFGGMLNSLSNFTSSFSSGW